MSLVLSYVWASTYPYEVVVVGQCAGDLDEPIKICKELWRLRLVSRGRKEDNWDTLGLSER